LTEDRSGARSGFFPASVQKPSWSPTLRHGDSRVSSGAAARRSPCGSSGPDLQWIPTVRQDRSIGNLPRRPVRWHPWQHRSRPMAMDFSRPPGSTTDSGRRTGGPLYAACASDPPDGNRCRLFFHAHARVAARFDIDGGIGARFDLFQNGRKCAAFCEGLPSWGPRAFKYGMAAPAFEAPMIDSAISSAVAGDEATCWYMDGTSNGARDEGFSLADHVFLHASEKWLTYIT